MSRKVADCRDFPGDCTLTIAGEEPEVLRAAADHAVSVHGYKRTPDLENELRQMLKDEVGMPMAAASAAAQAMPKH